MGDDDRHWFAGFYYNRDDPRILVPRRLGFGGRTLNLARPASWAVVAVIVLIASLAASRAH